MRRRRVVGFMLTLALIAGTSLSASGSCIDAAALPPESIPAASSTVNDSPRIGENKATRQQNQGDQATAKQASTTAVDMNLLNRIDQAKSGSTFTIDPPPGYANNWRKIREKTVDGVKYVLLVYATAYWQGTFAYPESHSFDSKASSQPPDYNVSTLRGFMTKVYENADFPTINAMAVQASLGDHLSMYATSEPTTTRASDSDHTDVFFALSR